MRSIDISTSGLVAQRQRMNTIASNLANLNTTRGPSGQPSPFQRRFVTFEPDQNEIAQGVTYRVEVDTDTPPRYVKQPNHPDADAEGRVAYPNINMVTEFVNAVEASRAYQANIAALEISKQMIQQGINILR